MRNFEYFEPKELGDAIALLSERRQTRTLAGGTDLIPQMKKGLISPGSVINIARIAPLGKIEESNGGLRIGAAVPLAVLEKDSLLLSRYTVLQKAISHVGTPSIRNAATLGGNICLDTKCIYRDQVQTWKRAVEPCFKMGGDRCYVVRGGKACHASLASDTVPALIALGADVCILSSSGSKTIPMEALYTGNGVRPLALSGDALVTQITLPSLPADVRSAYFRFSHRKAIDFPLVSAAFYFEEENGCCSNVRVVLGAVAPQPVRLSQLEKTLKGKQMTRDILRDCSQEALAEALRISKSGRIDAFCRKMIVRLVYQGLTEVSERK